MTTCRSSPRPLTTREKLAQITPPIGFNLFVLQGMTNHEIGYITEAALPMFLNYGLDVFILIAVPDIATWLPENIRQTR